MTKRLPAPVLATNMVYDSPTFMVLASDAYPFTFEILRKRDQSIVCLIGIAALALSDTVLEWQKHVPFQADVEERLEGLTQLGTQPIVIH